MRVQVPTSERRKSTRISSVVNAFHETGSTEPTDRPARETQNEDKKDQKRSERQDGERESQDRVASVLAASEVVFARTGQERERKGERDQGERARKKERERKRKRARCPNK